MAVMESDNNVHHRSIVTLAPKRKKAISLMTLDNLFIFGGDTKYISENRKPRYMSVQ